MRRPFHFRVLQALPLFLFSSSTALRYNPSESRYNLNQNSTATSALDYFGEYPGHEYHPSPKNWRFPFYTLFLDRFANGDPVNDDANRTVFEKDPSSNQLRYGGDVKGLLASLDYIQGMGIKGIYIAGTPWINMPWGADGYSPLDLSLLDRHFGDLADWREMIEEVHKRNMYVLLDTTISTMGDLIGFYDYPNRSAPFNKDEYRALYKTPREYQDFHLSNSNYTESCDYPRFWQENGERIHPGLKRCYQDDFGHYGDIEGAGTHPDWQRQLTRFASVQDRLREWRPDVMARISHFACLSIRMLDFDGFRIDKATQITVDALSDFSEAVRKCAGKLGKKNFFIAGEISGGDAFGSVYIGRGREPKMYAPTPFADSEKHIRGKGKNALDAGAFHYTVYRALTRFLLMDGKLSAGYDTPTNWEQMWTHMSKSNDFINPNTGDIDPRHMLGATNQDVFRWPAIKDGERRQMLGLFITTLVMPGIPKLLWGEEQSFYILDNSAANFIYGRQPMTSSLAWQLHGCYRLDSTQYFDFPVDKALRGCEDEWNSLDHRDPSAESRNVLSGIYQLREAFPSLNDGLSLKQLSNFTDQVKLPGSDGVPTEVGIWSVARGPYEDLQDFTGNAAANAKVWLIFSNNKKEKAWNFTGQEGLLAPFEEGTTVKNLFYPYEKYKLVGSEGRLEDDKTQGAIGNITMPAWGYKALVQDNQFFITRPAITRFLPGHDARIESNEEKEYNITIFFSANMDCDGLVESIGVQSITDDPGQKVEITKTMCHLLSKPLPPRLIGGPPSVFSFSTILSNVQDGIHRITINNASTADGASFTRTSDHFLLRIGNRINPLVFPRRANYSDTLVSSDGKAIQLTAPGAEKFRYSLDWGHNWSSWHRYRPGRFILPDRGTAQHIIVQYWSSLASSADHFQHGDTNALSPKRIPQVFLNGPFNDFGTDKILRHKYSLKHSSGVWSRQFSAEWPVNFEFIVGKDARDRSFVYGDLDNDGVPDRMPPSFAGENLVKVGVPPKGYLSYVVEFDDGTWRYRVVPAGSAILLAIVIVLMTIGPVATAAGAVWVYMLGFYRVKTNKRGKQQRNRFLGALTRRPRRKIQKKSMGKQLAPENQTQMAAERPRVLIATLEYNITDWDIKIKIGGLGVMAQLMGQDLKHQDLVWVVPCVGGVAYPLDVPQPPIEVVVSGVAYEVLVQYHQVENITYVLLDAPIFRKQTKAEPYPARMDDIDSAIFYSAWNQCIAEVLRRNPTDIYHINDYHGALAPLHLLPSTIPCILSLHNAEFQGLWPMRTAKEKSEVCGIFNISEETCAKYVQFGDVFNLLHAGASYLRIHQKGFGAVGVSAKYGKRSWARYPIFWGLDGVSKLPNPDPTDTAEYNLDDEESSRKIVIDFAYEKARGDERKQAQEWAGLTVNPKAELLVFVGRWSYQKGIDLIADVAPSLLGNNPNVQILCIGPVIDLYGRFAALKLGRLMEMYPGRVFSKPEFTALPPYIFSGAEFALIPSRDEPFGLVAVEFGRKGALGIGARVGGLGNMPGWWYTVEATTPGHLTGQFESAIKKALSSDHKTRARMRAAAAKQRFPVQSWVKQLEKLQAGAKKNSKPNSIVSTRRNSVDSSGLLLQEPLPEFRLEYFEGLGLLAANGGSDPNTNASPNAGTPSARNSVISPASTAQKDRQSMSNISSPNNNRASVVSDNSTIDFNPPRRPFASSSRNASSTSLNRLSVASVVSDKPDWALSKVNATFTDADGQYARAYEWELEQLDANNSKAGLCIEEYLQKSEREWFKGVRLSQLGYSSTTLVAQDQSEDTEDEQETPEQTPPVVNDEKPPCGLRLLMVRKFGEWPVYSFILALGQILAANSYQITLLTPRTNDNYSFYIVIALYLLGSGFWWFLYRRLPAVYVLSPPFALYALSFLLIALSIHLPSLPPALYTFAAGAYTFASSSGAFFFSLNFGDEGGAPVKDWVWRACIIQGSQQAYVLALWYWGSTLSSTSRHSKSVGYTLLPICVLLLLTSILLATTLPPYYRRLPGSIPSFYPSLLRRTTVKVFLFATVVQNFFLSPFFRQNWSFLFSSRLVPAYQIGLLTILFFFLVWGGILTGFAKASVRHSWVLPVFAIGLGAPRWAQTLWATTGLGSFYPLPGRVVWLWLGVLDALQGVGLGMVLFQTLARMHVAGTLTGAQILGAATLMVARGFEIEGKEVFADLAGWRWGDGMGLIGGWFWVGLVCQGAVAIGFAMGFRKEQLGKP